MGKGKDASGNDFEIKSRVSGDTDPGYAATARMLGESAVCLALDKKSLPQNHGILTPASAMGISLVGRLRGVGMILEVMES